MDIAPQRPKPLLCGELVMEILSWVPAKPLTRFKLVCKSWNSIISHPHFVKLHLYRSPKTTNLLLRLQQISREVKRSVVLISVRSFIQNPSVTLTAQDGCLSLGCREWVLGSCNGLVCIADAIDDVATDFWFHLWNPLSGFSSVKSPFLSVSPYASFGFGYDEPSDRYKVVAVNLDINDTEDSWETSVEVYSFGGSSWRNIESFPAFPLGIGGDGLYIGGTLNWLALQNTQGGVYDWDAVTLDMLVIVSLEVKSETYKQIQLPIVLKSFPLTCQLLKFVGIVCIFYMITWKLILLHGK